MRSRRCFVSILVLGAFVAAGSVLHAEVAAVVDEGGAYERTVIRGNASIRNLRIWSAARSRYLDTVLNPHGDLNGDLWPAVLEDPFRDDHPWVVWSRFNGEDYDLAWSRWSAEGWTAIRWIASEPGPFGDYDPDLALHPGDGRPHAAWWQDHDGIGRVFVSTFLLSRWSMPFLVSDPGVDSRYPTVTVEDDDDIRVEFSTPDGTVIRTVVFHRPLTITDDLDPLEMFSREPIQVCARDEDDIR